MANIQKIIDRYFDEEDLDGNVDTFIEWTRNKTFPEELKTELEVINLSKGVDIKHSYAYTVLYMVAHEGFKFKQAMKYFEADLVYLGRVIYKTDTLLK